MNLTTQEKAIAILLCKDLTVKEIVKEAKLKNETAAYRTIRDIRLKTGSKTDRGIVMHCVKEGIV